MSILGTFEMGLKWFHTSGFKPGIPTTDEASSNSRSAKASFFLFMLVLPFSEMC